MKKVYNLRLGMVVLLLVSLPLHISQVLSEYIVCFLCHTLNRSYKRLLFNFICSDYPLMTLFMTNYL